MQRSRVKAWTILTIVLAALALLAYPLFVQARFADGDRKPSCISNLKQLGLGLILYADDADGVPPPRDTWMDKIEPYTKNKDIERCPQVIGRDLYGYALNAGVKSLTLTDARKPLVYDSINLARNASDLANSLPVPGRHDGKDCICYADGHTAAVLSGPEPNKKE